MASSRGSVVRRSTSSAAWPGHCVISSTIGGERSGYASTGMRWKETVPATTISAVNISTTKRCCKANWTMRWIMRRLFSPLVLQRILELQEEAAVADDALAFLEAVLDQRAAILTVADFHQPPRKLIGA